MVIISKIEFAHKRGTVFKEITLRIVEEIIM